MKIPFITLLFVFAGFMPANFIWAANPLDVVISEICWMGTGDSSADEWIELYNNTNKDINLAQWGIYENNGKTLIEPLLNSIPKFSYYIIERTDDTTIPDILASQTPSGWSSYGLKNSGEHIQLIDNNSNIIDDINCSDKWFAGEAKPDYKTMERKNLKTSGASQDNWQTSATRRGTPMAENSKPVESKTAGKPTTKLSEVKPPIIEYPDKVIINEILPSPDGPDVENEWVEIFNKNDFSVDVSNWEIADTQGKTKSYFFQQNTIIKAKSFLLLPRPQTKITLNNDADGLNLIHPNGTITHSVVYKKAKLNQSYNRISDNWVWSDILTPGWENIIPDTINNIADDIDNIKGNNVPNVDVNRVSSVNSVKTVASKPIHFTASLLALFSAFSILALKLSMKP